MSDNGLPGTATGVAKCGHQLQAGGGLWLSAATREAASGQGWLNNEFSWWAFCTSINKEKKAVETGIV